MHALLFSAIAAGSIGDLITWVTANWSNIAVALVGLIGAASLLIKALETVVSALDSVVEVMVGMFPGLKSVDGELKLFAKWLDGLSSIIEALAKSRLLNTVAASPKKDDPKPAPVVPAPVVKAMILFLAVGALLMPARAQAAAQVGPFMMSEGVSLPFLQYAPGNTHPVSIGEGLGAKVGFSLPHLSMMIGGVSYDMLAFDVMAFGSLVSGAAGATFGQLQLVAAVTTLNDMLGLGYGHSILDSTGAFPGGPGFLAVIYTINFAFGPGPVAAGAEKAAPVRMRGNTIYF